MRLLDRQPGAVQMGETWHPDARPKTEHSVSLDLAVSPKTEQTGMGAASINVKCLAAVMGVV